MIASVGDSPVSALTHSFRVWPALAVLLLAAALLSCGGEDAAPVPPTMGAGAAAPVGPIPGKGEAPAVSCDRIASPAGSDANPGTVAAPVQTAQRLIDVLAAGQTGCLRVGTFDFDDVIEVRKPSISLTSYPGERATLKGELKIEKGADHVTVSDLDIDGRSSYNLGPMVFAAYATFDNVDVTNYHTGICFILGAVDPAYGRAVNTVIENSRIHDCGQLPAKNGDHGIYVAHSDGAIIRNNWIYGNADRGIQLYPDSQGAKIYGNVIDGNGEGVIVSSDGETASNYNLIRDNVISNSTIRWNVESNWGGGLVGSGNVVLGNCLWATNDDPYYNRNGGIIVPFDGGTRGFAVSGNLIAEPEFADRAAGDLRMRASSRCLKLLTGFG